MARTISILRWNKIWKRVERVEMYSTVMGADHFFGQVITKEACSRIHLNESALKHQVPAHQYRHSWQQCSDSPFPNVPQCQQSTHGGLSPVCTCGRRACVAPPASSAIEAGLCTKAPHKYKTRYHKKEDKSTPPNPPAVLNPDLSYGP